MAMTLNSEDIQAIAQAMYGRPVWFVRPGGNDTTGDGLSWATAYATIGKAVTALVSGDMILVGPGTYTEAVDLSDKAGVRLKGAGIGVTTITQNSSAKTLNLGYDGATEDLLVINGKADAPAAAVIADLAGRMQIRNVYGYAEADTAVSLSGSEMIVENVFGVGAQIGVTIGNGGTMPAFVANVGGYVSGWSVCAASGVNLVGRIIASNVFGYATDGGAAYNCDGIWLEKSVLLAQAAGIADQTTSQYASGIRSTGDATDVSQIMSSVASATGDSAEDIRQTSGILTLASVQYGTTSGTSKEVIAEAVVDALADSLTITTPVAATSEGGTVGAPLRLTTWQHTRLQVLLTIEDAQGVDVDLSGHDLSMLIYANADSDTVIAEWTTGTELTAGLGTLAIDAPATDTAHAGDFLFVIRDNGADDTIWAHGSLKIKPAPDTPAV